MATYFQGNSEIQTDNGLQTLILMNPAYVNYTDSQQQHQHQHHQQQPNNFFFLNSAAGVSANSLSAPPHPPHAPPPHHAQQFVGIPLPATAASQEQNPHSVHAQHEISAMHGFLPRVQYNLWNSIDPAAAAREISRAQQGLSLSLSSQQAGFGSFRNEREQVATQAQPPPVISPTSGGGGGEEVRISGGSPSSASGISNGGVSGMQSVLLSSKYLKAAQQLLDEVVNVVSGIKTDAAAKKTNGQSKIIGESSVNGEGSVGGGETSTKRGTELSTAERQEIQMKKAKLASMLDEVEQRYRQYHHQMQIVISSFEQAAGIGSAKTYTALALQTISKQFRCLKDAILGQIRAANKSLGEEDCLGGKMEGSRLKFVDHHLRQQRALQQLGMIQHNAWRPQRGLPERSVSVLRAWLFEHFLHPYPKDSDKHMLAKQTGLTRSQVSNWFINARVRLWKPMVEEMYLEEIKEHEQNGSEDKTSKLEQQNDDSASKSSAAQEKGHASDTHNSFKSTPENNPKNHNAPTISTSSTSVIGGNLRNQSGFTLIGSSELEGITHGSPKKQRSNEILHHTSSLPAIDMDIKPDEANNEQVMQFGIERQQGRDGGSYSLMGGGPANFIGGFGSYSIGEIGRFDTEQYQPRFPGNAVSLTLGLPDNENLSLSGNHQSFFPNQNIQLGRRVEIGEPNEFGAITTSTSSHSTAAYDNINIQNRKRFAAQLLPDFVA